MLCYRRDTRIPQPESARSAALQRPGNSGGIMLVHRRFVHGSIIWCVLLLQLPRLILAYSAAVDDLLMVNTIPASWVMRTEASPSALQDEEYYEEELSVEVKDVAQALEYTSKLNRILQENVRNETAIQETTSSISTNQFRGGSSCVLRLPMHPASPTDGFEKSMFHSFPNSKDESPLELYLKHALDLLPKSSKDTTTTVLALAMVYLDRACSVDTPRGMTHPCPFCAPDTLRRLLLTAILVAARANGMSLDYQQLEASFGVSRHECEQMMARMMAALGEPGVFVTPEEMRSFSLMWQTRFPAAAASSATTAI